MNFSLRPIATIIYKQYTLSDCMCVCFLCEYRAQWSWLFNDFCFEHIQTNEGRTNQMITWHRSSEETKLLILSRTESILRKKS